MGSGGGVGAGAGAAVGGRAGRTSLRGVLGMGGGVAAVPCVLREAEPLVLVDGCGVGVGTGSGGGSEGVGCSFVSTGSTASGSEMMSSGGDCSTSFGLTSADG